MRSPSAPFLATCVALAAGCAHTDQRNPTAWLRTSVHHPASTIIAESGGPKPSYRTERYVDGAWRPISPYAEALVLASGARVVIRGPAHELRLVDAHGDLGAISCAGQLRTWGARTELSCVEVVVAAAHDEAPVPIALRRFDARGLPAGATWRGVLPASKPEAWSERVFIGFDPADHAPIVVVSNDAAEGAMHRSQCAYYALRDGQVVRLAEGVVRLPIDRRCDERSTWESAFRLRIDEGATLDEP